MRALAADGHPASAVTVQNAAYTLCVLTGTRTVEDALSAVCVPCPGSMTPGPSRPQTLNVPTVQSGLGPTEAVS
jgi:hypothetical protein